MARKTAPNFTINIGIQSLEGMKALEISIEQIVRLAGVDIAMVEFVRNKITSGEWETFPEQWTEEEWEAYFDAKK